VFNLAALVGIQNSPSRYILSFYGSLGMPIALVTFQAILGFLMLLGIHPTLREYIEPNDPKDVEPSKAISP